MRSGNMVNLFPSNFGQERNTHDDQNYNAAAATPQQQQQRQRKPRAGPGPAGRSRSRTPRSRVITIDPFNNMQNYPPPTFDSNNQQPQQIEAVAPPAPNAIYATGAVGEENYDPNTNQQQHPSYHAVGNLAPRASVPRSSALDNLRTSQGSYYRGNAAAQLYGGANSNNNVNNNEGGGRSGSVAPSNIASPPSTNTAPATAAAAAGSVSKKKAESQSRAKSETTTVHGSDSELAKEVLRLRSMLTLAHNKLQQLDEPIPRSHAQGENQPHAKGMPIQPLARQPSVGMARLFEGFLEVLEGVDVASPQEIGGTSSLFGGPCWKRRFVVINEGCITTYKTQEDATVFAGQRNVKGNLMFHHVSAFVPAFGSAGGSSGGSSSKWMPPHPMAMDTGTFRYFGFVRDAGPLMTFRTTSTNEWNVWSHAMGRALNPSLYALSFPDIAAASTAASVPHSESYSKEHHHNKKDKEKGDGGEEEDNNKKNKKKKDDEDEDGEKEDGEESKKPKAGPENEKEKKEKEGGEGAGEEDVKSPPGGFTRSRAGTQPPGGKKGSSSNVASPSLAAAAASGGDYEPAEGQEGGGAEGEDDSAPPPPPPKDVTHQGCDPLFVPELKNHETQCDEIEFKAFGVQTDAWLPETPIVDPVEVENQWALHVEELHEKYGEHTSKLEHSLQLARAEVAQLQSNIEIVQQQNKDLSSALDRLQERGGGGGGLDDENEENRIPSLPRTEHKYSNIHKKINNKKKKNRFGDEDDDEDDSTQEGGGGDELSPLSPNSSARRRLQRPAPGNYPCKSCNRLAEEIVSVEQERDSLIRELARRHEDYQQGISRLCDQVLDDIDAVHTQMQHQNQHQTGSNVAATAAASVRSATAAAAAAAAGGEGGGGGGAGKIPFVSIQLFDEGKTSGSSGTMKKQIVGVKAAFDSRVCNLDSNPLRETCTWTARDPKSGKNICSLRLKLEGAGQQFAL